MSFSVYRVGYQAKKTNFVLMAIEALNNYWRILFPQATAEANNLAALASAKDHYLQKMEKVYSSHSYK
jgi:hypothetical protein